MIRRLKAHESACLIVPTDLEFILCSTSSLSIVGNSSCSTSGTTTAFLPQIIEIFGDDVGQIAKARPLIELGSLLLRSLDTLDFAKLRTDNLDKDLILLEECRLKA